MHERCELRGDSEGILRNVRAALIKSIILAFIPVPSCIVP